MNRLPKTYCPLILSLAVIIWISSCRKETAPEPGESVTRSEIVFCSGDASTKSDMSYMQDGGRFVCKMYYHSDAEGTEASFVRTDTVITWFKVDGTKGNALYWNKKYSVPDSTDGYGDANATRFYWKNRRQHAFLALADNNRLTTDTGEDDGGLRMSDTESYIDTAGGRYCFNTYYLTSKKDNTPYSSMSEQPDPILAFVKQIPEQFTVEGNRVYLNFSHQFSIVQVNIMNSTDGSVMLTNADSVKRVELLGISEEAYVPHQMLTDGGICPTFAKKVDLSEYTEEQKEENEYGTSMSIFRKSDTPAGSLAGFEAIAFGTLQAIRVVWKEEIDGGVGHVLTFVLDSELVLQGGRKYIFNLELRRSTLVLIRVDEITNWGSGETYESEGSQKID